MIDKNHRPIVSTASYNRLYERIEAAIFAAWKQGNGKESRWFFADFGESCSGKAVAYAFLKNQILSYLFLRTHFVFFDFEKPVLLFVTEHVAMMGLFVFLAHYSAMLFLKKP